MFVKETTGPVSFFGDIKDFKPDELHATSIRDNDMQLWKTKRNFKHI